MLEVDATLIAAVAALISAIATLARAFRRDTKSELRGKAWTVEAKQERQGLRKQNSRFRSLCKLPCSSALRFLSLLRPYRRILVELPPMAAITITRTAADIAMALLPVTNRQEPRVAKCTIRIALPLAQPVRRRFGGASLAMGDI